MFKGAVSKLGGTVMSDLHLQRDKECVKDFQFGAKRMVCSMFGPTHPKKIPQQSI